jgi:hypothetical protein
MRRKRAHIVSGKLAPSACPNCLAKLNGFTGARIGGFLPQPLELKGQHTMCAYCGAMLVFADDQGHLRMMTEAERNSLDLAPVVQFLYDKWRREKTRAPDFTRKRYN